MLRRFRQLAVLSLAGLACAGQAALPARVWAIPSAPSADAQQLFVQSFEPANTVNYTSTADTTWSTMKWAPTTLQRVTGTYGMAAAGNTNPLKYVQGMYSDLSFPLPTAEYYSSRVEFKLIQPTLGSGENRTLNPTASDGLTVRAEPNPVPVPQLVQWHNQVFASWTTKSLDMSAAGRGDHSLSRRDGSVTFRFTDDNYSSSSTHVGAGPVLDDVRVTGYRFGPVRSVGASVGDGVANVTWARPYRSTREVVTEERAVVYGVWRAPSGSTAYTAVAPAGGVTTAGDAVEFNDPIVAEGVTYDYVVQAWGPGWVGYGQSGKTSVSIPVSLPTVSLTAPTPAFEVGSAPIAVTGTADDSGTGVASVKVRIRDAEGSCWNGTSWVGSDTWLAATSSNQFVDWTYTWTPGLDDSGRLVTVAVKAIDGAGNETPSSSRPSVTSKSTKPAIMLQDGDAYTDGVAVPVAISAQGMGFMRRAGETVWSTYADSATIDLDGADGSKSVTFEFSGDGSSVESSATDEITLDRTAPVIEVSTPAAGFSAALVGSVSGVVSDGGSKVPSGAVKVRLTSLGKYWNGTSWQADPFDLPVTFAGGDGVWSVAGTTPSAAAGPYGEIRVAAYATDGVGNVGNATTDSAVVRDPVSIGAAKTQLTVGYQRPFVVAGTFTTPYESRASRYVRLQRYSGGVWRTVKTGYTDSAGYVAITAPTPYPTSKTYYRLSYPGSATLLAGSTTSVVVMPGVYMSPTPWATYKTSAAVKTFYRNRTYTWRTALKPYHTSGKIAGRVYIEKYSTAKRAYVPYTYRSMYAYKYSSYSRMKASYVFRSAGKYRVRTYHYDSAHAKTYSSWKYITVR